MREIKFRAWDGNKMRGIDKNDYFSIRNDGLTSSNVNLELMQYTGLKDRNGVEIYEEHELNNKYGVRFEKGKYILYNISTGDRFQNLNEEVINGYKLKVTREYTKMA